MTEAETAPDAQPAPPAQRLSTAREGIRLGSTLVVIMLATTSFAATVAKTAAGFAGGESGQSGVLPGALPYATIMANTALILLPVLIAPLAFHSAGFAARLPKSPSAPRFLAATALTWLAMGATGVANPWIRYALGQEQWTGISSTHPISSTEMTFLAVNAGLAEEAAHLAIPAGLIFMLGSFFNVWRRDRGKSVIPAHRLWLIAATAGPGIALAARAAGHLYQGHVSALLALVWGLALIAVFLWVRSVWPIMIGHFIYDVPVDYNSWAWTITHHVGVPAALAALSLAVTYAFRSRQQVQVPYTS